MVSLIVIGFCVLVWVGFALHWAVQNNKATAERRARTDLLLAWIDELNANTDAINRAIEQRDLALGLRLSAEAERILARRPGVAS